MALCTQLTGDLQKRQQIDKKTYNVIEFLNSYKKKHLANFWFAKIENVFTNG